MKDLIFIGGAKGCGKSTLINEVHRLTNIPLLNTGTIIQEARIHNKDIDSCVFTYLNKGFQGIVDTHYAGYNGLKFTQGLATEYLSLLKQNKSIDLILIDSDTLTLYDRRKKDSKTRILDIKHIGQELENNRIYFQKYCLEFNVHGLTIYNYDFNATVDKIINRIYER